MKNFKYFLCILIIIVFTYDLKSVEAASRADMEKLIEQEYSGFFMKDGTIKSLTEGIGVNFSRFEQYQEFYYGNTSNAIDNSTTRGKVRFMGRTSYEDNFLNRESMPDGCTTGDIKGRSYMVDPFDNKSKLNNNKYKPRHDNFNNVNRLVIYFDSSGKSYSIPEVTAIKRTWLNKLNDSYAMDDPYEPTWDDFKSFTYDGKNTCWKTRTKANQWTGMGMTKREQVVHITQIPTEISYGQFVAFHKAPASQGNFYYYDNFLINPLMSNDFVATKLEIIESGGGSYEIFFTVRNDHGKDITLEKDLPTRLRFKVDGVEVAKTYTQDFGTVWKKAQSKRVKIGEFSLGPDLPEGTAIEVEAKYNHNEKLDYTEIRYDNNMLTKKIFTETYPVCTIGGGSENKLYSYRVTDYDRPVTGSYSDGTSYIYYPYTICKNEFAYLNHSASLDYNKAKQTLVGTWSLNTKGHSSMTNVPKAYDAKPAEGKYFIEITEPKFKELKINPIRRILRAGRDVSMYSTMDIEMSIMSFEGGGDIDSRKEAFKQELIRTLKANGVDVGSDAVKNNNKKDSVQSIVNDDIGISEKAGPLTFVEFGEDSCIKIKRFQREYEISIPIKTKNEGGIQNTNQGDFSSDITYEVSNVIEKFYTDINTKDGLHALQFETNMDGSKIGPGVGSMLCKAKPERFGVQGNIYDDVRADETNNHDDDWDF